MPVWCLLPSSAMSDLLHLNLDNITVAPRSRTKRKIDGSFWAHTRPQRAHPCLDWLRPRFDYVHVTATVSFDPTTEPVAESSQQKPRSKSSVKRKSGTASGGGKTPLSKRAKVCVTVRPPPGFSIAHIWSACSPGLCPPFVSSSCCTLPTLTASLSCSCTQHGGQGGGIGGRGGGGETPQTPSGAGFPSSVSGGGGGGGGLSIKAAKTAAKALQSALGIDQAYSLLIQLMPAGASELSRRIFEERRDLRMDQVCLSLSLLLLSVCPQLTPRMDQMRTALAEQSKKVEESKKAAKRAATATAYADKKKKIVADAAAGAGGAAAAAAMAAASSPTPTPKQNGTAAAAAAASSSAAAAAVASLLLPNALAGAQQVEDEQEEELPPLDGCSRTSLARLAVKTARCAINDAEYLRCVSLLSLSSRFALN